MIPEISATLQDSLVDHVTYEYNIQRNHISFIVYSLIEMPHWLAEIQVSFLPVFFLALSGKSLSINNEILKESIDCGNTIFIWNRLQIWRLVPFPALTHLLELTPVIFSQMMRRTLVTK